MIYKGFIIVLAAIILATSGLVYADNSKLSIDDVLQNSLKANSTLEKQKENLKSVEDDYNDSIQSSIRISGVLERYERLNDLSTKESLTPQEEQEYSMLKKMMPDTLSEDKEYSYMQVKDLSPANLKYALHTSTTAITNMENQIKLTAYSQYSNLISTKQSIDLQKALVKNLEKSQKIVEAKYKMNFVSKIEYLTFNAKLQKANLELKNMQNMFQVSIININKLMDRPITTKYDDYINIKISQTIKLDPIEKYIETAMQNKPEVINAKEYFDIKSREYELTKNIYPSDSQLKNTEAKYNMDCAADELDKSKYEAEASVVQAYRDTENKLLLAENADRLYQINKTKYAEAQKKYSMGKINEVQLTDSSISLSDSEIKLQKAQVDLWLSNIKLDIACGKSPDAIK